jgi:hypothetical protein
MSVPVAIYMNDGDEHQFCGHRPRWERRVVSVMSGTSLSGLQDKRARPLRSLAELGPVLCSDPCHFVARLCLPHEAASGAPFPPPSRGCFAVASALRSPPFSSRGCRLADGGPSRTRVKDWRASRPGPRLTPVRCTRCRHSILRPTSNFMSIAQGRRDTSTRSIRASSVVKEAPACDGAESRLRGVDRRMTSMVLASIDARRVFAKPIKT